MSRFVEVSGEQTSIVNSVDMDDWTPEPAIIVRCGLFFSAKPGCRIALFNETYPNLTLNNIYDDGSISISCDPEQGWRGQGNATCLGSNRWTVPTCSSKSSKIFSYVFSKSAELCCSLVQSLFFEIWRFSSN